MKVLKKLALVLACAVALATPTAFTAKTQQVQAEFTTTATGYTKASDVKYDTSGTYMANWGARGEDCTFLSKYATSFYTGNYTYEMLSLKSGGSTQSDAYKSALYSTLQTLMSSKHSKKTNYGETRYMYCYTDCVSNDTAHISSFYSGGVINGTWGSNPAWNREHTWPNSKGLGGDDENDIMMLRPTLQSENSSRGNTAYGQSSGYYDPNGEGTEVRGDCARIFLYVYVRWGNTSKAWGASGVMESVNVLLKWMEEDPVDTWEMGRNDVVQDITGTRNVFVDYPELAWKLFGKEIPGDMPTPSGKAVGNDSSSNSSDFSDSSFEDVSSEDDSSAETVTHEYSDWFIWKQPTETEYGERVKTCIRCGDTITEILPIVGDDAAESTDSIDMDIGDVESIIDGAEENCNASIGCVSVMITMIGACALVMKKREN